MKRLLAKLIHLFNKRYFKQRSYWYLGTWNIEDVIDGKLVFKKKHRILSCEKSSPENLSNEV